MNRWWFEGNGRCKITEANCFVDDQHLRRQIRLSPHRGNPSPSGVYNENSDKIHHKYTCVRSLRLFRQTSTASSSVVSTTRRRPERDMHVNKPGNDEMDGG
jgi:hypothetical protein